MTPKHREKLLTPKQAAAMFSPPVARITAYRWMAHGLTVNGKTIRLKATRLGSRWMTTAGDIEQFIQECQETIK